MGLPGGVSSPSLWQTLCLTRCLARCLALRLAHSRGPQTRGPDEGCIGAGATHPAGGRSRTRLLSLWPNGPEASKFTICVYLHTILLLTNRYTLVSCFNLPLVLPQMEISEPVAEPPPFSPAHFGLGWEDFEEYISSLDGDDSSSSFALQRVGVPGFGSSSCWRFEEL